MPALIRRRTFPVINALGIVIAIFGLLMFFPLACSLILNDGASEHFKTAFYITFLCGLLIWLVTRQKERRDLYARDGFLLVALVWLILPNFGALPLLFNDVHLSFTDAYFEANSGLTATGASVLLDVENLPRSLNIWRTFLHWIGGMGIIVLVVAILPLLGIGGRQLFKVEVPTPMKESSLTPRITETAKGLWLTYILLTIACGLSLYYAGMTGWDALIHAFTVTGLGGFSNYNDSLAHFHSIHIETVTVFFAMLAGMNYATHYLALTRHSLNPYFKDAEIRVYLGVLLLSALLLGCYLSFGDMHLALLEAMRYATFHVVSIATSLGLTTQDYTQWPVFAQLWLLFLGSFVSCSGSTGGGIKLIRAIILYKQVYREIIRSLHPNVVYPVRISKTPVAENVLYAVLGFSFMYMVSIVTLTLIMTFLGASPITAFSAVIACINNTGPGMDLIGPMSNYSTFNDLQTWVLAFTMTLGRLEIFTLLVVLTPAFWRR